MTKRNHIHHCRHVITKTRRRLQPFIAKTVTTDKQGRPETIYRVGRTGGSEIAAWLWLEVSIIDISGSWGIRSSYHSCCSLTDADKPRKCGIHGRDWCYEGLQDESTNALLLVYFWTKQDQGIFDALINAWENLIGTWKNSSDHRI